MEKRFFIQVINQNRGTIRSLCKVYYANEEDQKDAFQDIVLQLWKSVGAFRGQSDISTWIYRVGLNTILSKKRKEQSSAHMEPLDRHELGIQTAYANDDLELLHLVIQTLKDLDKAIVILHLEGYRNKEIAEILKLSQTNVATRFNRIKTQLKLKFKIYAHAAKRS